MKTVHSLQKESIAYQLYDRVKKGEKRTINEWAEEFNTLPMNIARALNRLRKINCHLHPVGTITDFKGESKSGTVVDIMEKEEWFQEVYERAMKNRVLPSLKDFYRKTETALGIFPRLRHHLTVAFNTVFSYLKVSHDIMKIETPKVPAVRGSEEKKQEVLEAILEQVR